MELFIYFCINVEKIGQFECMILVVDEGSYVSYIEGCFVFVCDSYQFYVVVVEVIIYKDVEVKYFIV